MWSYPQLSVVRTLHETVKLSFGLATTVKYLEMEKNLYNTVTIETYFKYFDDITSGKVFTEPYNDSHYMHYTIMSQARSKRLLKTIDILPETEKVISRVQHKQHWIIILEPWCADASHSFPVIAKMAELNPNISLSLQLRDSNSEIEKYLTDGKKSIPKLIARDSSGEDLFTWGPRPERLTNLFHRLKEEGMLTALIRLEMQHWYNADAGRSVQQEIAQLLQEQIGKGK